MSVAKRRAQSVNRRRWVAELRERWEYRRETEEILAGPNTMSAIAEALSERA